MKSPPVSSRTVIALGAMVIAIVLGMTSYEIWRQRANTIGAAERNLTALSAALALQTEGAFRSVTLIMDATRASIHAAGGIDQVGSQDFHDTLHARIAGTPQIVGLAVIAADGRLINSARVWPMPSVNVHGRDYLEHHRITKSDELRIGAPAQSPMDGMIVVPVTRRLSHADGSFAGVLLVALNPDYFQQSYRGVLPPEGGAFALFRIDGMLLARAPIVDVMDVGKNFSAASAFQPGAPDQGILSGISPIDHTLRILSFRRLEDYPLLINVSLRQDRLLEAWRDNAMRLGLAGIMAVLVLATGIGQLARQVRREETQAAALAESEHRLRLSQFALDHAADMIFWVDESARILYGNKAACRELGYALEDLTAKSMADIEPDFTAASWQARLEEVRAQLHLRFETRHRTSSGRQYPVEVAVNHLSFEGGGFLCVFAHDISARRAAESVLAEKTAKLEASNAELEQFAYVASHDLREPLRMVNSFVTILARRYGEKLDAEAREFIGFAMEGATRMDRLILDLLEYSRVGRLDRPMVAVSLQRVVELAVNGLGVASTEAGARIDFPSDLPEVLGSEEELVRLFLNLIGNAIKYHHPDRPPQIHIGFEEAGNEWVCRVTDNGIGIAPQYFDRIFRIFQRLHARDRYDGTGIGLAICKKIVERHQGRIWVESLPDQGTTFLFTLPRVQPAG